MASESYGGLVFTLSADGSRSVFTRNRFRDIMVQVPADHLNEFRIFQFSRSDKR